MLKFEHWDGKTMLQVEGNLIQVSADIGLLIHMVWEDLQRRKPKAAAEFKELMQIGFLDDSPAWKETNIQPDVRMDKSAFDLLEMLKRKREAESGESGT